MMVEAVVEECKMLKRIHTGIEGQVPDIRYGVSIENASFICPYYAGRGDGLDRRRPDSY